MLDLHGINKAFILQWNYENTAIRIINCAFELIMSKFATLHCQSLVWNCSPLYLQQSMVLNYQGHCGILVYINLHNPQCVSTRSSDIAEGPRDVSCQLKSCQLPHNSAETTCTTSPEQIEVMKLEGYSGAVCNKHVHSTMTWSSCFHCPIGVINKPTTDELWISPVYRRLAVAKFSKSTNDHNVEIAHVTLTVPT